MSLRTFHIVFIALSLLLSLMMGVWGFQGYFVQGGGGYLTLGVTGVVFLALLIPYIRWFKSKMSKLASMLVMAALPGMLGLSSEALACPMCFADPTSLITKGISGGILFLVLLVGCVFAGILTVILSWRRRARSLPGALQD